MCKECGCQAGHMEVHKIVGECCGEALGFVRRYQTKAEQITELEAYLGELKKEVQAVEERLQDLRK